MTSSRVQAWTILKSPILLDCKYNIIKYSRTNSGHLNSQNEESVDSYNTGDFQTHESQDADRRKELKLQLKDTLKAVEEHILEAISHKAYTMQVDARKDYLHSLQVSF